MDPNAAPHDLLNHPDPVLAFCGRCGASGIRFDGAKRHDCPTCGWRFYHNPAAAVVAILTLGDRFVFTRRNRDPGAGGLDLPGGFVDAGESAEHALARELHEELSLRLTVDPATFLGSIPNTYPCAGITYHTVDLFYRIPLATAPVRFDPDEIAELLVLARGEIEPDSIALPSIRAAVHRWILT